MPKGLYYDADGWVMVDYGSHQAAIAREQYELSGYQPPYDKLPSEEQYRAQDIK
jgi:hypothetical protein